MNAKRIVVVAAILMACATWLAACAAGTRKLDEAVIYDGPVFKLKVVRYYENLPLSYTGEVFSVQCSSAYTAQSPGHKTQDPGWVALGSGGAIGSKNAVELVARERGHYVVLHDSTLAWTGNGFNITFDACGRFRSWYPTSLPDNLIDHVEKPSYCAPQGTADCRHYDFLGDRAPQFSDIAATSEGAISFTVRSKAIRGNYAIRVTSDDWGKAWTWKLVE